MKDLALFEVNMNRVAPATGVVLDCPDFHIPDVRGGGQPTRVHIEGSVGRLDGPGEFVGACRAPEYEFSAPGVLEFLIGEDRLLHHHQSAGLVVLGVHGEIHLTRFHGLHTELHEASHDGVAPVPSIRDSVAVIVNSDRVVGFRQYIGKVDRIFRTAAALVLQ